MPLITILEQNQNCCLSFFDFRSSFEKSKPPFLFAFVGFFLPLVVAFTSRNAARFSFLETQDCIRHRRIPPFFRRVTVLWGDSGDGGDSSFGIPPADCRNCHPHPLHDGHVDDDGVFGIPPSQEPSPSCRHSFIRSRKA